MAMTSGDGVRVLVVGVGGAGGNAIQRMAVGKTDGLGFLSINTDVQALRGGQGEQTFAIGPETTRGMGAGGNPDVGRKAARESQEQLSRLVEDADMVFVAAGMGGGTGTGAAPVIAEVARRQGALTVAVVSKPFTFEGPRRQEVADRGLGQLRQKVDTLITVENDRLLSDLDGMTSLDSAFELADQVLRQGVLGISDIVTVPGVINVDFADVKAVLAGGGQSFMATGEGRGKRAASDALRAALSNPLFDAPLEGAEGVLMNIKGGKDLAIGEVHEVAAAITDACGAQANVIFGMVQERKWKKRVSITLVATGLGSSPASQVSKKGSSAVVAGATAAPPAAPVNVNVNGYGTPDKVAIQRLL